MKPLTIKLSPTLYYEVYVRTVESGLTDHRGGNIYAGLSNADVSVGEKIEKSSSIILETIDEAASLYNDLYNLMDLFEQWAEEDGIKWRSVAKAAQRQMRILASTGIEINDRGWAKDKSGTAPLPK